MAAIHTTTIRTPYPTSHTQIACNGTYIAMPFTKSSVGVWSVQSLSSKPLELVAHKSRVCAISFGNQHNPTHVCTAGANYIIVWNVEKARATYDTGQQIRGTIIGTKYGRLQYVSFAPEDRLVAVCVENDVFILDAKEERLDTRLEGHTAMVTCAEFCLHDPDIVVSASEDRTFKVWNIANQSLVYQSSIVSSSPFLCLAINPFTQNVALGTADGQLRIYDLSEGNGFRCLHQIDVARHIRQQEKLRVDQSSNTNRGPNTISSKQSWQNPFGEGASRLSADDDDEEENLVEYGENIMGLAFSHSRQTQPSQRSSAKGSGVRQQGIPAFLLPDSSLVEELKDSSSRIIVGTPGALLQLNASSCILEQYVDFRDPVKSDEHFDEETKEIGAVGGYSFFSGSQPSHMTCIVGSLFQNAVNVLSLKCMDPSKSSNEADGKVLGLNESSDVPSETDTGSASGEISVISDTPLQEKSLLRSELFPKASKPNTPGAKKQSSSSGSRSSQTSKALKDQPLTFKAKVSSSGYSKTSNVKMFSPNTRQDSGKRKDSSKSTVAAVTSRMKSLMKEYPLDAEPPKTMKTKLSVSKQASPIHAIQFTDDGQSLACAMADRSAQVFSMPLTGKGTAFSGHNGVVNDVSWSHDGKWILTASCDQTARIWTRGMTDPVMIFDCVNNNFGLEDKSNVPHGKEINHAQFYYGDRFVLLSTTSLFMYKYYLDTKVDDIKRYQTKSRYKLVKQFQPTTAQSITAISAINTFNSYIVMYAGSDKSIEVFDMNVGKSAAVLPDVHSRAIHAIAQNQGSMYASHASRNYDLFATAAVTEGIKVWDLRSQKCVKHLEGHVNRAHRCGLCFSPCGKYIATGAEDRSAYIYDLREGTYVRKLSGHTNVVSDVSYHPLYSEVVTATLDGQLKLFSDR